MFKRYIELLEGIPATIVSGCSLVLSFILTKLDTPLLFDPALVAIILSGLPIIYSAIRKLIKNRGISKISSALLISTAMIAAMVIGDLFAAGEVAFIMAIGEILEDLTTDKAKKGLRKLISLMPQEGRVLRDGSTEMVAAKCIKVGDVLRILPGESVPVDGKIISGETSIDQSVITGESLPLDKAPGDSVFCGTINCYGTIDIKATNIGSNSSLQKLITMVKQAETKKAPMARTADKSASLLVPLALLIAILTLIITKDITRAVTVLVVFCPCALVLATPTAIMAAIGQATKHGVIIKSGEALEKMGKTQVVTFDKTGTLTYGQLEVSDIAVIDSRLNEENLLEIAASLEAKSEHPIAKAIVNCAVSKGLKPIESHEFRMTAGRGVEAKLNGIKIFCGNEGFIADRGITFDDETSALISNYRQEGKALVLVAAEKSVLGLLALADCIRPEAGETVNSLKRMKLKTCLLTGDNNLTADYFASRIGVDEVIANLLPEGKVEKITDIQQRGKVVCMVGDGVNDAPALKIADVGIAMGNIGSDIAVDAADISLISDDISRLPYLKKLSNATLNTIKLSITLSMVINILAVILSVLGVLNPTLGALVHNAGSVFVVMIAAMLYERKFN